MIARLLSLLYLSCCAAAFAADVAPTDTPVIGDWVLNKKASTDPEDAFDDKLRREAYPVPQIGGFGAGSANQDLAQMAYWDKIRKNEERSSSKKLKRLGIAYPLVKAERITLGPDTDGYRLTYDGEISRHVRPNPNGHVYSAKGDELVEDSFGHTLSFWEGDTLVLEAEAPEGGRIIERLRVRENPHQLEYLIRVALPVVKQPVELKRVYDPAGAARGR